MEGTVLTISGDDIAAIITAFGVVITAAGAVINTILLRKVKVQTDGMSTQLQDIARKEGRAEGVAQEQLASGATPTAAVATASVPVPVITPVRSPNREPGGV